MEKCFTERMANFVAHVAKELPDDVFARLKELQKEETVPIANAIYTSMFENLALSKSLNRPLCQDTGVVQFFVRMGTRFPLIDTTESLLREATRIASEKTPLRPNAVEPFYEKNTGTNLGTRAPWIEFELIPGADYMETDVYMAGGGCSLPGRAQVFMPSAGYEGIIEFVADTLVSLGVNACPPLLVGVGVGACAPTAAKLSKKAAMRLIGTKNPDPLAAEFEEKLARVLTATRIGPQGMTGDTSILGVHAEFAARHPSTLAAGVSFGCWAHRRGIIRIESDMSYQVLSHRGVVL